MYQYWGFGLNISSELEFPELLPHDFEQPDLVIAIGAVPALPEGEPVIERTFSSISETGYVLRLEGICRYYADNGRRIIAEPAEGIDLHSVRLFLLGTVIAAILYQRGQIPLHASAISRNGRLLLFAGNSGSGKSTLAAGFAGEGYELFTDDICVLRQMDGSDHLAGLASYPMVKLWEDAISRLNNEQYNMDYKVRPRLPKYGQFFYEHFCTDPLPVEKIFILNPTNDAKEITVDRLQPVDAFRELEKQAYKSQLITGTKLRAIHFRLLSQLSAQVEVYRVTRPLGGSAVQQLAEAVEKHF